MFVGVAGGRGSSRLRAALGLTAAWDACTSGAADVLLGLKTSRRLSTRVLRANRTGSIGRSCQEAKAAPAALVACDGAPALAAPAPGGAVLAQFPIGNPGVARCDPPAQPTKPRHKPSPPIC